MKVLGTAYERPNATKYLRSRGKPGRTMHVPSIGGPLCGHYAGRGYQAWWVTDEEFDEVDYQTIFFTKCGKCS